MKESEIIPVICTVVSTLLGVWGIVYQAFRRRDKEIKQLLLSEQEFKDHKEQTRVSFMSFSKQLNITEEKLNNTLERIDRKLDRQDEVIGSQASTLARLDERIKDK